MEQQGARQQVFLNGLCSVPESVLTTTFRYLCACNPLSHGQNHPRPPIDPTVRSCPSLRFFVQLANVERAKQSRITRGTDVALKYDAEASSLQPGGRKQSEEESWSMYQNSVLD